MRMKRDNDAGKIAFVGLLKQLAYEVLMSTMHAIELADRNGGRPSGGRSAQL